MKINLQGDTNLISEGLELLSEDYGFELSDDGIFLKAIHDGDISECFPFFCKKKKDFSKKKRKNILTHAVP